MRTRAPLTVLAAALMTMGFGTAALAQFGGAIGAAIKIFGIGYAVKAFGPQINSFLNTVLMEHNVGGLPYTKVVPIIRVGSGTYVGAAQVAGPTDATPRVQAVGEGQLNFGQAQLRYLVPVSSLSLKQLPSAVPGVGVSAIIDFHV
jgi:hypothetical protein